MRNLLKFLLMPVLAGAPVMSVVACGTSDNSQVVVADILQNAAGAVSSNNYFEMTDLKMDALPADNTAISSELLTTFTNKFQNAVISSNPQWAYKTVKVTINQPKGNGYIFHLTAGSTNLQATANISLTLELENQTKNIEITLVINNNKASSTDKANDLQKYIATLISSNSFILSLDSFPQYNNTSAAGYFINNIQTSLTSTLKKEINLYKSSFAINLTLQDVAKPFLATPTFDQNDNVESTLQNVNYSLSYTPEGADASNVINVPISSAPTSIKVQESSDNMQNQITSLLGAANGLRYTSSTALKEISYQNFYSNNQSDIDAANATIAALVTKYFPVTSATVTVKNQSANLILSKDDQGYFNLVLVFQGTINSKPFSVTSTSEVKVLVFGPKPKLNN